MYYILVSTMTSTTTSTSLPSTTSNSDKTQCGSTDSPIGMDSSDNGEILSPNYPKSYPNNAECVWHVTVSDEQFLHITFIHFDLESGYVQIRMLINYF